MTAINVSAILRRNAFVERGAKRDFLRVSKEAEQEIAHRVRDVWIEQVARSAAEIAARRGARTISLADALDAMGAAR